jgi:DNA-binding MarR family transcriptional regulator
MTESKESEVHFHREHFRRFLAELGITEAYGVELLRLVRLLANSYDMIMAERMRKEHLSAPRWRLLLRLHMEERLGNPSVNPTQLSKTQNVSKNTISAHLRTLEEQGLIEREIDPEDLRQFRIRLSDAGRELIRNSTPGHMTFLNELAGDLTAVEREQLQNLLRTLHSSLCRHGNVSGNCAAGSKVEAVER